MGKYGRYQAILSDDALLEELPDGLKLDITMFLVADMVKSVRQRNFNWNIILLYYHSLGNKLLSNFMKNTLIVNLRTERFPSLGCPRLRILALIR